MTKVPLITGLVGTLNTTLGGLTRIVDTVTSTAGLSFDTSALYENLNLLSSVMTIDQGAWSQTATLSPDGTMIIVDLDKGLGPILANNIINILQNLKQAVNNLNVTVTGNDPLGTLHLAAATLNTTLAPIKTALTVAIDGVLTPVLNDAGILTQQLLDVSLLGSTTVNVPTTINIPTTSTIQGTVTSKFVGTIVQSDILDVSLFSGSDSSSNIYWNGLAVLPTAPVISNVTGNSQSGYVVTGTADPGNTVKIIDPATGQEIGSGLADSSGNYSITLAAGSIGANADINATATDAAGNVSVPTAGKTPADSGDTTAPDAPAISSVTGNSTDGYTVTGTAEAGSTVTIKDSTGTVIGTAVADESGNYSVSLPASVGANADITATATDEAGNESTPTTGKTPADSGDTTAPDAPIITNVTGNSTDGYTVTGTAEAGSTVTIKDSTGTVIGSGVADGSGNYSVSLPASVGPNADITVTATDEAGNESTPTTGKTPADSGDTTAPDAPAISSVTGNSTDGYTVTGTAEAGSTVTIKDSTGTVIGSGVADGSGNYSVTLPASVGPNADITATATDEAGNESAPTTGKTPADSGDTTAPDAPAISSVTGNSTDGYTVTGTAEAGSTVTIKDSTGAVIGTAVADGSGNYSVSLPASVGPNADITATATDEAGNESAPTKDKTPEDPKDSVAPSAPTITNVTGNSTDGYTVTGKAEAGSTVEIKNGAGKVIGTALADSSGNYTVSLPKGSIGANATITATAIDAAGNESTPTTGKTPADPKDVTAPDSPKVTDVTKNPDGGYNIGGTAEPGSTVTIKDGNGNVIASGKTDDSGHFHITLPAGSVKPGDLLNITATDEAGNESTASHVQIPSGTIVPVTFGGTGGQYSNGLPASYAKGVKLPATGERDNNIQTVVGFSLLAFLSLMLTKLRRKKNVL
ncbi:Ig-like domain-containing protein [Lactococcus formosensis]|uniref:Ig-like domain-containing protein n=1 Tax=Lactococcus formosensis TaxID=1281486 RepID=UPI002435E81C|nr:Ig-like domain-containing protein [Lactococcus formosensis]MDG6156806.1 Ig-like domain-containing protein [Lactococcus formosensis]